MSKETATQGKQSGNWILWGILAAIIAGSLVGGLAPELAVKTNLLGHAFINALKMMVVPLVITSLVAGVASLGELKNLGSMGWRTLVYYMATTGISVLVGLLLVNLIKPGSQVPSGETLADAAYVATVDTNTVTLTDVQLSRSYSDKYEVRLLDSGISGLIVSAEGTVVTVADWEGLAEESSAGKTISGTGVEIALPIAGKVRGKENRTMLDIVAEVIVGNKETGKQGLIPSNLFRAMVNMDVLSLIFFALLLGMALTTLGERGKVAIDGFVALNDAVMKIVHWLMVVAPIGIFGLVAARIGKAGGFAGFWPELHALGSYAFTVIAGLAFHGVVVLPLLLWLFAKRNPLTYAKGMGTALLNAFSTASSSATLPLTMEGVEDNNGVSNRTASFVCPLGATVNMDGTALYEAVAAMFIAQVYGIELGIGAQTIIFLTATLAAIGAAGIPEAGLVTMVVVLKAVDLPVEGIALILAIDWFLDRCRTTLNVWGDSVGAAVIERYESRSATRTAP